MNAARYVPGEVPEPGIYEGIPDAEYHAMPGLSSTGMKRLLRSPKHYKHMIENRVETHSFDVGHAVHAKVLGVGMGVIAIPEDVLASNGAASTKAAKEFIAEARVRGLVPLKADVVDRIDAISEAVLAHPRARALFSLPGRSEVSMFAIDPETGASLRGRIDRLAYPGDAPSVVNVDLKTTTDVRDGKVRRAIEDFGYDIQSETYQYLLRLLDREPAPTELVFVEVEPPHEVRVVTLSHESWIEGGRARMRRAIDLYAACVESGEWPGAHDGPDLDVLEPRPYYLDDALDLPYDLEITF